MIAIILCHLMLFYNCNLMYIFNTGVQVFFIISGFLYSTRTYDFTYKRLAKMFRKILIPYYTFILPIIIIYFLFSNITWGGVVGVLLTVHTIKGLEHLWFVPYILFCYLLLPYLKDIGKMGGGKLPFLIVLFNIISIFLPSFFDPSCITCFIIGYFYNKVGRLISKNNFLFVCFILLSLLIYMYTGFKMKEVIDANVFKYISGYSHMLMGLFCFHYGKLLLEKVFKVDNYNNFLGFSDKFSYPIYICHQLFILSPFAVMSLTSYSIINIAISLFLIIIVGVAISKVSSEIFKLPFLPQE